MPLRSRSRFPRSSGARRKTSWAAGPETSGGGGVQTFTGTIAQLAGTAVQATVDGLTLVRTRGELLIFLRTASASDNGFFGAFGIAKATSAAVLAGAASVPTPIAEESWDGWLYHRYLSVMSAGPIAAATAAQEALQVNNVCAALRIEIDSKAMRKQDISEAFYAVLELTEVGTADLTWQFNSRLLLKLP